MQLSAKGADAELTKDGIVSALGYTPPSGDWELINSLTTDADTNAITASQDSAGNTFRLSKICAAVELPVRTDGTFYVRVAKTGWLLYLSSAGSYRSFTVYAECVLDTYVIGYVLPSIAIIGNGTSSYARSSSLMDTGETAITQLYFGNSVNPVAAGTKILIYGIRMN